jgi:hypothetical protein
MNKKGGEKSEMDGRLLLLFVELNYSRAIDVLFGERGRDVTLVYCHL